MDLDGLVDAAPPQIAAVLSGYILWMQSWDASVRTIEARAVLAKSRLAAWGLDGFTPTAIQGFLGTPGWSRWTRATYHAHLKSLCEYLEAAGHIDRSPMGDVRKVSPPRALPRPLSSCEMTRIMAAAREHRDPRLADWITLARRAGLRCHEIAKLRGADLTDRGLYVDGKGGKQAVLPIHPDVAELAQRHPADGYWFPSPYRGPDESRRHIQAKTLTTLVSEFFNTLGISGSIHRVRHTYGTELLRSGVDLRTIQMLMRHSSLGTTEVYTFVDSDRLASAINGLPAA